jgi:hypothetical protein
LQKLEEFGLITHFAARPSMLPPSPIVMYVGAVGSNSGVHKAFVMLYLMFDTVNCIYQATPKLDPSLA